VPSADLLGKASANRALSARSYLSANAQQAKYLDMLLSTFAPKEHRQLKQSAMAGRWYTEQTEGCTLGLATVWKLQVDLHLDTADWELCMIVCGGNFSGGNLYLPDLNICLAFVKFSLFYITATNLFLGTILEI
jgi:hypothetical protein